MALYEIPRLRPFGFAVAGEIRFCESDDILHDA